MNRDDAEILIRKVRDLHAMCVPAAHWNLAFRDLLRFDATWSKYTADELAELQTDARELRGCGCTVQQIARALKMSQAEVLTLLGGHSNV